jgi:hypothetical protein
MDEKEKAMLLRGAAPQAVVGVGLSLAHSWRARGGRRSLLFAALGVGLPTLAEYVGINHLGLLRHHTGPQWRGVPLPVALGWYNIGYATFALTESLLADWPARQRRWAVPLVTALLATDLDLLTDPFGLDMGMWEWREAGPYAPDIAGPNGQPGIPAANYAGWLALTITVTGLYTLLAGGGDDDNAPGAGAAGSVPTGRGAALLLLPYTLGAAAWAVRRRKFRFLLYAAPVLIMLLRALLGRRAGPLSKA